MTWQKRSKQKKQKILSHPYLSWHCSGNETNRPPRVTCRPAGQRRKYSCAAGEWDHRTGCWRDGVPPSPVDLAVGPQLPVEENWHGLLNAQHSPCPRPRRRTENLSRRTHCSSPFDCFQEDPCEDASVVISTAFAATSHSQLPVGGGYCHYQYYCCCSHCDLSYASREPSWDVCRVADLLASMVPPQDPPWRKVEAAAEGRGRFARRHFRSDGCDGHALLRRSRLSSLDAWIWKAWTAWTAWTVSNLAVAVAVATILFSGGVDPPVGGDRGPDLVGFWNDGGCYCRTGASCSTTISISLHKYKWGRSCMCVCSRSSSSSISVLCALPLA